MEACVDGIRFLVLGLWCRKVKGGKSNGPNKWQTLYRCLDCWSLEGVYEG